MAGSGRSRNAPCFCGSGRKLKQRCGRSLKRVRLWSAPNGSCRWRFWKAHGPGGKRFAGEVGEHVCTGERAWLARGTPHGVTWMIDQHSVTLLEAIDCMPASLYGWLIDQTYEALGRPWSSDASAGLEAVFGRVGDSPVLDEAEFAEIRVLTGELIRLAHAGDVLAARMALDGGNSEPGSQRSGERVDSAAA